MKKAIKQFVSFNSTTNNLVCHDEWVLTNLIYLEKQLSQIKRPSGNTITVDGGDITKMDSAGAWLLSKWMHHDASQKLKAHLEKFSPQHQKLMTLIEEEAAAETPVPEHVKPGLFASVGVFTVNQINELKDFFTFTGMLALETLRLVRHPGKFRFAALVNVLDSTGFRALPIIALLSFMIGVVIAYQMGNQLRSYGANLFIVDFLGLAILREFGPLITAIMVAGRTGSAFTAQIGTMKINQEVDALNTMGVTPAELLLLPRVFGLFITLPLLTMWADLFGIMGGMLMAHNLLGITPHDFLVRFRHVIPLKSLIIGLCKAPVFALIIGSIGCFEGMRVGGSADSVGKQTTRSVVLSIFFIIVVDAFFSVILSKMKI
jgi:phospholipid/cholesterol/gamma-HCH transport system permease protein